MSTALRRLRATRRTLAVVILARALAWSAAIGLVTYAGLAMIDLFVGIPLVLREGLRWTIPLAAIAAGAVSLWRGRAVASLPDVALWVEEQVPALRYSLVTATEPRLAAAAGLLEPTVAAIEWRRPVVVRAVRSLGAPFALALASLLVIAVVPAGAAMRVRAPAPGDALDRARVGERDGSSVLRPIVVTVTPPSYTGERTRAIEDPATIAAPVGSRIVVQGRVPRSESRSRAMTRDSAAPEPGSSGLRLRATVGDSARAIVIARDRWSVSFAMPSRPAALRLTAGDEQRILAFEPRPDSAPNVVLTLPQRDSVHATPGGILPLAGEARDDYGLATVSFEYIVTSGEGERFTFREGTLGRRTPGGERRADLTATLSLDSLALGPGDVVHVRAVARDANAVSGAATGVSETRAIRIARRGEGDSLAIEGAPPPEPDRAALSQRMLIILTEALEARRPQLQRATVIAESRNLARDQSRLRRLVGEIIFTRLGDDAGGEHAHGPGDGHDHTDEELERLFSPDSLLAAADRATGARAQGEALDYAHGESPVLAINRPLLEAYNHMWDAGRELEQGEPGRALPPMRRALDALQEARSAERYYLRGRPPTIVVDIERVRLARREAVAPARRARGGADQDVTARHADRYAHVIELLSRDPEAAIDSLMLLRIDALENAPPLARALGEAIEALRAGRDATPALLGARRAIEGPARARPLGRWSGW